MYVEKIGSHHLEIAKRMSDQFLAVVELEKRQKQSERLFRLLGINLDLRIHVQRRNRKILKFSKKEIEALSLKEKYDVLLLKHIRQRNQKDFNGHLK